MITSACSNFAGLNFHASRVASYSEASVAERLTLMTHRLVLEVSWLRGVATDDLHRVHGAEVGVSPTACFVRKTGIGIHDRSLDLESGPVVHSVAVDDVSDLKAGEADVTNAPDLVAGVGLMHNVRVDKPKSRAEAAEMAQHNIKLSLDAPIPIGNVDAEFEVRQGRRLLGHVRISRGGIDWHPAHKRRSRKTRWTTFAEWMESG